MRYNDNFLIRYIRLKIGKALINQPYIIKDFEFYFIQNKTLLNNIYNLNINTILFMVNILIFMIQL